MYESVVVVGEAGVRKEEGKDGAKEREGENHEICGGKSQQVSVGGGSSHGFLGEDGEVYGVADYSKEAHGGDDVVVENVF